MKKKTQELFVFRTSENGDNNVTNMMPVYKNSGLTCADDALSQRLCDKGVQALGVPFRVKTGQIVRISFAVESVDVAEFKIITEFKPFARMKKG
jgi:hypothetical protein